MRQLGALGENEFVLPSVILRKMKQRNKFGELWERFSPFLVFPPKITFEFFKKIKWHLNKTLWSYKTSCPTSILSVLRHL